MPKKRPKRKATRKQRPAMVRSSKAKKRQSLTEADFEARIDAVVQSVFPALSSKDISHQTCFRIRLGHKIHEISGGAKAWAGGRSDVVLSKNDKHLALLELKRDDLALTDANRRQALSYARLMDPWPPLTILSNGKETLVFETFTGNDWHPTTRNEHSIVELFKQSAKIADGDIRHAVETLLGPGSGIWTRLVREFTSAALVGLTGPWEDLLLPFPEELILPRKAAAYLAHCITTTAHVPVIVGPPLSRKSNVLREFALRGVASPDYAVLFVDADSSGHGILQTIANLLSNELGIQFSLDQVRAWLRHLSQSDDDETLVLAIDCGSPDALRTEIDELVSDAYGPKLRLAIAVDEGSVDRLMLNSTGRQKTKLGRLIRKIEVKPLDDEEFLAAQHVLHERRIGFFHGSHRAPEHRVPWLLRSTVSLISSDDNYQNEKLQAMVPSIPGIQPLAFAFQRFHADSTLRGRFAAVADAVLDDIDTGGGSVDFRLHSVHAYICRTSTLQRHLSDLEINELLSDGYLKLRLLPDGERLYVPQLPAFVAACISQRMARRLLNELNADVGEATDRLVLRCSKLPFGEVIGAKSLVDAAYDAGGLPLEIVTWLLDAQPKREPIPAGSKVAAFLRGQRIDIDVLDGGKLIMKFPNGKRAEVDGDPDDLPHVHADITAWLILSYFAAAPIAVLREGNADPEGWLDPSLLTTVGTCKYVLRRPAIDEPESILVHELPGDQAIVCHKEGLIEPITYALMQALRRDQIIRDGIIKMAKGHNSLPLFSRINIALLFLEEQADEELAAWAANVRSTEIQQAFKNTLLDH